MMNLNELKNDTARANAIREKLSEVITAALVAEFGDENVINIKTKITVNDSDIAGNTVAVKVGTVTVDGEEVDAVATVAATVKSWKTKTNKAGKTTYSVSLADIKYAIESEKSEK